MKRFNIPDEDAIIELFKIHKTVKKVAEALKLSCRGNRRLLNIGRKHGFIKPKCLKKRVIPKTLDREVEIIDNYSKYDNLKINDKFKKGNRIWTIISITLDKKNTYHCIDNFGWRSSFHLIDIINLDRQIS
jgi:hypothetical protein